MDLSLSKSILLQTTNKIIKQSQYLNSFSKRILLLASQIIKSTRKQITSELELTKFYLDFYKEYSKQIENISLSTHSSTSYFSVIPSTISENINEKRNFHMINLRIVTIQKRISEKYFGFYKKMKNFISESSFSVKEIENRLEMLVVEQENIVNKYNKTFDEKSNSEIFMKIQSFSENFKKNYSNLTDLHKFLIGNSIFDLGIRFISEYNEYLIVILTFIGSMKSFILKINHSLNMYFRQLSQIVYEYSGLLEDLYKEDFKSIANGYLRKFNKEKQECEKSESLVYDHNEKEYVNLNDNAIEKEFTFNDTNEAFSLKFQSNQKKTKSKSSKTSLNKINSDTEDSHFNVLYEFELRIDSELKKEITIFQSELLKYLDILQQQQKQQKSKENEEERTKEKEETINIKDIFESISMYITSPISKCIIKDLIVKEISIKRNQGMLKDWQECVLYETIDGNILLYDNKYSLIFFSYLKDCVMIEKNKKGNVFTISSINNGIFNGKKNEFLGDSVSSEDIDYLRKRFEK